MTTLHQWFGLLLPKRLCLLPLRRDAELFFRYRRANRKYRHRCSIGCACAGDETVRNSTAANAAGEREQLRSIHEGWLRIEILSGARRSKPI
jgi:hypothetical protein